MSSPSKKVEYGSIVGGVKEEGGQNIEDRDYQLGETYYLKQDRKKQQNKNFKRLFPVLLSILIMGGIAYALMRDFHHLYPDNRSKRPPKNSNSVISRTPGSTKKHEPNENKSSCEANPKCLDAGLGGLCCPTGDNVFLGCCE
mmetsp:Transcript_2031/g.3066  ORF Transcript_2031/g.3066 Transcript_2031/m.3066 type:complete len:142 (+) Transcript_2031:267-692(+)